MMRQRYYSGGHQRAMSKGRTFHHLYHHRHMNVVDIVRKHDTPPMAVLRSMFKVKGHTDAAIKRILQRALVGEHDDSRLCVQVQQSHSADLCTALDQTEVHEKSQEFEMWTAKMLQRVGAAFRTERRNRNNGSMLKLQKRSGVVTQAKVKDSLSPLPSPSPSPSPFHSIVKSPSPSPSK